MARNNLAAKIIALILAIILWLYVMNEQNPPIEANFTIALEVKNLSSTYVVDDVPDTVRIRVRGPRSIVASVLTKDIKAYIDLKGLNEGQHSVKVAAIIPSSLDLVEINPDRINLVIDKAISRQMPVEVRMTGELTAGITVNKVVARPEQVTIEGPRSVVDAVDKVVAAVDISGKQADFTVDVPLKLLNKNGKEVQGLTIYSDKVTVSATLLKGPSKKMVDVKPFIQGDLAQGVELTRITTEPSKVEISGPTSELEKLEFVYTEPINLGDITKATSREVKLQLKEGIVANKSTVKVQFIMGAKP